MKAFPKIAVSAALWISTVVPLGGGCCWFENRLPTPPMGTQSDAIWRRQEAGAAASDFVIYQHEFEGDGARLNLGGEDHLKAIAARLHCGAPLPVIIERSSLSVLPNSEFHYPVNPNPELDVKRRDAVVGALLAMGICNAEQCVVVATPLAEGSSGTEAVQAYNQGLTEPAPGLGGGGYGGGGGMGGGGGGSNGVNSIGGITAPY
jgi:hypothetical protein